MNLWAHKTDSYEAFALSAIRSVRSAVGASADMVIVGDFNSTPKSTRFRSAHRRLLNKLRDEFELVSAYHVHHGVETGTEPHQRSSGGGSGRHRSTSTTSSFRRRGVHEFDPWKSARLTTGGTRITARWFSNSNSRRAATEATAVSPCGETTVCASLSKRINAFRHVDVNVAANFGVVRVGTTVCLVRV